MSDLKSKYVISQQAIDRYGAINGDNDLIHYDEGYAKERGFRGTLAHGLMVMAYAAELGAIRFGQRWHEGGRISVKWTAPVCPGDHLTVSVDENGEVHAAVSDFQREGEVVMVGQIGIADDQEPVAGS